MKRTIVLAVLFTITLAYAKCEKQEQEYEKKMQTLEMVMWSSPNNYTLHDLMRTAANQAKRNLERCLRR